MQKNSIFYLNNIKKFRNLIKNLKKKIDGITKNGHQLK